MNFVCFLLFLDFLLVFRSFALVVQSLLIQLLFVFDLVMFVFFCGRRSTIATKRCRSDELKKAMESFLCCWIAESRPKGFKRMLYNELVEQRFRKADLVVFQYPRCYSCLSCFLSTPRSARIREASTWSSSSLKTASKLRHPSSCASCTAHKSC